MTMSAASRLFVRPALPALALTLILSGCGRGASARGSATAGAAGPPGVADSAPVPVEVSAAQRGRLGIMTTIAMRRELVRDVRLVGRVVPAETAARTVTTKVDGFVERLYVDFTGRAVRRGEPLFELYSPMLVAAEQELLLALRLRSALGPDAAPEAAQNADSLVAASRRRLEYWDIEPEQIAELERSGAVRRTLTLRAPVTGVVLQKNVVQGQAIMAGAPLFQLADLSTVWLEADVFESDLSAMRVGLLADVEFDAYPGETMRGHVAWLSPIVDPAARTGRVRIELSNAGGRIRPGLFATVHIATPLPVRGVVIPRQAALVTGDRQLVFVEDSTGRFLPRLVRLGVETDSLVEVLSGLRAGERVVATAAFLLDAETNLGAAMAAMNMGPPAGERRKAAPPPAHQH
jgi:membrane fusion protein, copper/silver efflux system